MHYTTVFNTNGMELVYKNATRVYLERDPQSKDLALNFSVTKNSNMPTYEEFSRENGWDSSLIPAECQVHGVCFDSLDSFKRNNIDKIYYFDYTRKDAVNGFFPLLNPSSTSSRKPQFMLEHVPETLRSKLSLAKENVDFSGPMKKILRDNGEGRTSIERAFFCTKLSQEEIIKIEPMFENYFSDLQDIISLIPTEVIERDYIIKKDLDNGKLRYYLGLPVDL